MCILTVSPALLPRARRVVFVEDAPVSLGITRSTMTQLIGRGGLQRPTGRDRSRSEVDWEEAMLWLTALDRPQTAEERRNRILDRKWTAGPRKDFAWRWLWNIAVKIGVDARCERMLDYSAGDCRCDPAAADEIRRAARNEGVMLG